MQLQRFHIPIYICTNLTKSQITSCKIYCSQCVCYIFSSVSPFPGFSFPTWRNRNLSEVSSEERVCVSVQTVPKIMQIQSLIIDQIPFHSLPSSHKSLFLNSKAIIIYVCIHCPVCSRTSYLCWYCCY